MKSDLVLAITQLAAEKNLPKEVVIGAVETALAAAFKKDSFTANPDILVRITPQTGEVEVYVNKLVVEEVIDSNHEISLNEARKINSNAQVGETLAVESTPKNAGRIAAQTAKQVVLQRLREAERDAVFAEYHPKEGSIITGVVQHVEHRQVVVDLGKTEALLPISEQIPGERYRIGQRIKVFLTEVLTASSGPQLIVSRTHPALLQRLFELEVPEIHNGTVELKAVAREAGYRSKVAVAAHQEGVDPIGCCVGLRGIRIQNIVAELNGEKIDVVQWHQDPATFITNALSPASTVSVELDKEKKRATVVVPDRQLSLAIGKDGQNARLAAKLTGWRIDLKSASTVETGEVTPEEITAPVAAEELVEITAAVETKEPAEIAPPPETLAPPAELEEGFLDITEETEEETPPPEEEEEALPITEIVPPPSIYAGETPGESQIRFAEDILPSSVRELKTKKGKKFGKSRKTRRA